MDIKIELNNIYTNKELIKFVRELYDKYETESNEEKYKKLVNFSTNIKVPFHNWFPYREGFSWELIDELINDSNVNKTEIVVDPFCGSGTTNVVASSKGYDTFGIDANPMSAFITNVKLTNYSSEELNEIKKIVEENNFIDYVEKESYKKIKKYFVENNYRSLVKIKTFIDTVKDQRIKDFLTVAFLSIVMECSDRKRDGNGLKLYPTKITSVKEHFKDKVSMMINDIINNGNLKSNGNAIFGSACNLYDIFQNNYNNKDIGTIIFSPPYANSFDYFESYKLELYFGEFVKNSDDLNNLRTNAIRSFIGTKQNTNDDRYVNYLAEEIEKRIPIKEQKTGKKDCRTRKVPSMIKGYFSDMFETIRQCSLCLAKNKKLYIVVDQSAYLGIIIPTDLLFCYYGEKCGFEVEKIIECRKARTSTQQLNQYPYLKDSLRESIIVFKKRV